MSNADVQSGPALAEWFRGHAPQLNALLAQWAERAAAFEDCEGWRGAGMRSCAEWFVTQVGFGRPFAEGLLRAGHAARSLPEVEEAFCSGELSLEKVRLLGGVATTEDQGEWVRTARASTPQQLARKCREARSAATDDPERARVQRSLRSLHAWTDELGMVRIHGVLPREDGWLVRTTIDRFANALRDRRNRVAVDLDPPEDPEGALHADALVAICGAALTGDAGAEPVPIPVTMNLHVDLGVLTGATPTGRGHIEDGPAVSTAVIRRLGCDCRVRAIVERDGMPVGAGSAQRIVPEGMRRLVQNRDRICRFPTCSVPASRTEAHHLRHWSEGGPTETWNLLSLCRSHHDDHHDGEFDIERTVGGDLVFTSGGRVLAPVTTCGAWKRPMGRAGP